MTLNFKKMLFVCFIVIATQFAKAQDADKTVTLTVSGSGKTLEEAKQVGLRSAIEQAYGAFISSKTEIFNDQIVADQIASVASGNIQSFQVLNEAQFPDGSWGITLKVLVSVNKLTSFVQAKGITVEIKGGLFAVNIKQQLLNEQGEINAVCEMVGLLHETMQISFDYAIKSSEPKSLDAESKNWAIPLVVTATANKNMDFCADYCIKTLTALSLTPTEVGNYKTINKQTFPVRISYKGNEINIYLRKQTSINALNTFTRNLNYYVSLFVMQSGINEKKGIFNLYEYSYYKDNFPGATFKIIDNGTRFRYFPGLKIDSDEALLLGQLKFSLVDYINDLKENVKTIIFFTKGQQVSSFSWNERLTIQQIEKITNFTVKPIGVNLEYKHGGFIVYEKNGHGLVVGICDLGPFNEEDAKNICKEQVLNGYSDWRLPTNDEIQLLKKNLSSKWCGGFNSGCYWHSYGENRYEISSIDVLGPVPCNAVSYETYGVRLVRTF